MASPRGYLDDALWLSDASETGLVGCCAFKTATAAVLGGSSQGSPWNPEKSPLFVAYPSCRYELWLRSTDIHGMILQVVSLLGGQLAEICEKISDQQVNDGKPEESFCFFCFFLTIDGQNVFSVYPVYPVYPKIGDNSVFFTIYFHLSTRKSLNFWLVYPMVSKGSHVTGWRRSMMVVTL